MERDELMPSICERLRKVVGEPIGAGLARNWLANPDGLEAADLIETLAAERDRLVEAAKRARDFLAGNRGRLESTDPGRLIEKALDDALASIGERG